METDPNHVDVAVAIPVYKTYTYRIPETLSDFMAVGKRVLVPFGNRTVTGYILAKSRHHPKNIKDVIDILDEAPLFPENMIPFFRWIAQYYIYPIGEVISCALPSGINLFEKTFIHITDSGKAGMNKKSLSPTVRDLLYQLAIQPMDLKVLKQKLKRDIAWSLLYKLEHDGFISIVRELTKARTKPRQEAFARLTQQECTVEGLPKAQRNVIQALLKEGEMSCKDIRKKFAAKASTFEALKAKELISIIDKDIYRDPFGEDIYPDKALTLNSEQQAATDAVCRQIGKGYQTFLLDGVTGSGKTEVYLQIAAKSLEHRLPVLILVPEIALISQTEKRFRARFGDCIAVLHSGLTHNQRYDQWLRILRQEAKIAIGARSAIFAPFPALGVIIVDEEHDPSLKQESQLRYNARDLAVYRGSQVNAVVLLGSATPSIQSIYNVATQKYALLALKKRIENRPLPHVNLVDLRQSKPVFKNAPFITKELYEAVNQALDQKNQALLFLNRRGFSTFPICSVCGQVIKCKNCDISLTLYRKDNAYRCHYCQYTKPSVAICPSCGSNRINQLGFGTEQLEFIIKRIFPEARVARMDRDTTRRKGHLISILKDLKHRKIDILVGTQMIAKGHDFQHVTVVGIVCADLSMNFPDFRASERTFQLLAQVAGRAGRGDHPGQVILQTYNPEHFSIATAKQHDARLFYDREIEFRKALGYPPFSRMIQIIVSGKELEKTKTAANRITQTCHQSVIRLKISETLSILGPVEAPLAKIAGHFRWQILLKGTDPRHLKLLVKHLLAEHPRLLEPANIKVILDVDPFMMM